MRIFNANGEKLYQEWVLRFCAKETKGQGPVPFNLLSDPSTSVDLGTDTPDPHRSFANKYEFITTLKPYIDACLAKVSQKMDEQRRVWDAFALMFFDTICPKDETGAYDPSMFAHYMIDDEGRSIMPLYQRHRIYDPYRFVSCNAAAIRPFFEADAASTEGGFEEDVGARQEMVGNPRFLDLLNRLYVIEGSPIKGFVAIDAVLIPDPDHPGQYKRRNPKRDGKRGMIRKCKPGSLRRLIRKTMQLKNTHDILQCSDAKMLELLGGEFTDWIAKKGDVE